MYMYIHVCVYMYVRVCVYIYIYIWIYVYLYMDVSSLSPSRRLLGDRSDASAGSQTTAPITLMGD